MQEIKNNPRNSKTTKGHVCLKPWNTDYAQHSIGTKRATMVRFHQHFGSTPPDTIEHVAIARSSPVVNSDLSVSLSDGNAAVESDESEPAESEAAVRVESHESEPAIIESQNNSTTLALEEEAGDIENSFNTNDDAPTDSEIVSNGNAITDSNFVVTEAAANEITVALSKRSFVSHPLTANERSLFQAILLEGSTISKIAAAILKPQLKMKKDGEPLERHEMKLLGQLKYKAFKSSEDSKLSLPSFQRYRPIVVTRVPGTYASRTEVAGSKKRVYDKHVAAAKEWMGHLPGEFGDELVMSYLKQMPKKAKEMISTHHKNLYRLSGKETLVLQAFCGMNDSQLDKLGRCLTYQTNGLRLLAPILEFGGGCKDTDTNMRRASFQRGDFVRQGMEAIFARRCTTIQIEIDGRTHVVVVKNTNTTHNRKAPKALPKHVVGNVDYEGIKAVEEEKDENSDLIVDLNNESNGESNGDGESNGESSPPTSDTDGNDNNANNAPDTEANDNGELNGNGTSNGDGESNGESSPPPSDTDGTGNSAPDTEANAAPKVMAFKHRMVEVDVECVASIKLLRNTKSNI